MSVREVKITDDEAAAVGVTKDTQNWAEPIRPLLISKGVPEAYLQIGDPRCGIIRRDPDGCVFGVLEE